MTHVKRMSPAVLALAALLVGCGNDSAATEETMVKAGTVSKAEFTGRANSICRSGDIRLGKAVAAYQARRLDEPSVDVVRGAARGVVMPALEAQVAEIRALGAPRGDAREIEEFLGALLRGVDEIIAEKPETFVEAQLMLDPAGALARRYGLEECEYSIVDAMTDGR